MSKGKIGVSLDESVINTIEERRGLVARSTYINDVLCRALNIENKGSPTEE